MSAEMPAWYDQRDVRSAAEITIGGVTPELTARVAIYLGDPALSACDRGSYVGTIDLDVNALRHALSEIEAATARARRTRSGTTSDVEVAVSPRAVDVGQRGRSDDESG
jgi:hypothetical protein